MPNYYQKEITGTYSMTLSYLMNRHFILIHPSYFPRESKLSITAKMSSPPKVSLSLNVLSPPQSPPPSPLPSLPPSPPPSPPRFDLNLSAPTQKPSILLTEKIMGTHWSSTSKRLLHGRQRLMQVLVRKMIKVMITVRPKTHLPCVTLQVWSTSYLCLMMMKTVLLL